MSEEKKEIAYVHIGTDALEPIAFFNVAKTEKQRPVPFNPERCPLKELPSIVDPDGQLLVNRAPHFIVPYSMATRVMNGYWLGVIRGAGYSEIAKNIIGAFSPTDLDTELYGTNRVCITVPSELDGIISQSCDMDPRRATELLTRSNVSFVKVRRERGEIPKSPSRGYSSLIILKKQISGLKERGIPVSYHFTDPSQLVMGVLLKLEDRLLELGIK
jgi:hypothetical protein